MIPIGEWGVVVDEDVVKNVIKKECDEHTCAMRIDGLVDMAYDFGIEFIRSVLPNVDLDKTTFGWSRYCAHYYVCSRIQDVVDEASILRSNSDLSHVYLEMVFTQIADEFGGIETLGENDLLTLHDFICDYFDALEVVIAERVREIIGDNPWWIWIIRSRNRYIVFESRGDYRINYFESKLQNNEIKLPDLSSKEGQMAEPSLYVKQSD